ncbi:hypothetical protein [Streptomyces nanshensis]|uniref:DNA-binding protein n=1 Tax=Streptomyces nanshensis TaxID=518642 RepID=A0A1E7L5Q8_9ACTN|nr:hypothetical protein [Streptomyces nanshensis]OEV11520.1 hypothetical protein AN218_12515 [Streptomyces nanshensis]
MKSPPEVIEAFAAFPQLVSTKQIAAATGRSIPGVQNWVSLPGFPGSPSREGRTKLRDKDAVLAWYLKQPFASTDRRGPRGLAEAARNAAPHRDRLTDAETARALKVTPATVRYYANTYTPESSAAPFPEADEDGRREWVAVRDWLLRYSRSGRPVSTSAGLGPALKPGSRTA